MVEREVRILYVEDDDRLHQIVPELVHHLGFRWLRAGSIAEAIERLEADDPHLVLTDLALPDGDGVELIEHVARRRPGVPVVVLSVAAAPSRVVAAIGAGACGYVLKEDLGNRLPSAIVEALAGGVPMSTVAARAVLAHVRSSVAAREPAPPRPGRSVLSPRERDVVEQLGRGLTYEQVATVLGVSINTVRAHVRAVYEKLGAASKTEAVMVALRRGLVHPS